MTQQFYSWIYSQKSSENTNLKRYMHPNVHRIIVYNGQDMETI